MTIIQITDLHINIQNSNAFGIDCQKSFEKSLHESIGKYQPDLIVISGDLCHKDPDTNVYQLLKNILNDCKVVFHVISGNHDDPKAINKIFYDKPSLDNELYFADNIMGFNMIFLDTTPGSMSEKQYQWFHDEIKNSGMEVFIFMHHPPVKGSVIHMDEKHSFKDQEKISKIVNYFPEKKFFIFTGHYHNERTIIEDNMTVFITPSTYVQIDDLKSEMSVYHSKPAYRVIKLDHGRLTSFVNYLEF